MKQVIHDTPTSHCPWCGHRVNAASAYNIEAKPEVGDISICFSCGEWTVFTKGLRLRKPTDDEFEVIGTDADCMQLRQKWTEFKTLERGEEHDGT